MIDVEFVEFHSKESTVLCQIVQLVVWKMMTWITASFRTFRTIDQSILSLLLCAKIHHMMVIRMNLHLGLKLAKTKVLKLYASCFTEYLRLKYYLLKRIIFFRVQDPGWYFNITRFVFEKTGSLQIPDPRSIPYLSGIRSGSTSIQHRIMSNQMSIHTVPRCR